VVLRILWLNLAVIFLTLYSGAIRAENCPNCVVPSSNAAPIEVAEWAKSVLQTSKQALQSPAVEDGDYLTSFGSVIAFDCLRGDRASKREKTINRIEKALAIAMTRVAHCQRAMEWPGIDAIPVLSKLRIHCEDFSKRTVKKSETVSETNAVAESHAPLRKKGEKPAKTPEFGLTFNTNDNFSNKLDLGTTMEVAEILFHETLHLMPFNHRSWHGQVTQDPSSDGAACTTARPFSDRIYLITASCFPNSNIRSSDFWKWKGGAPCRAKACELAFGEVDPSESATYLAYENGKDFLGVAHGKVRAKEICGTALKTVESWPEILDRSRDLSKSVSGLEGSLPKDLREATTVKRLFERLRKFLPEEESSSSLGVTERLDGLAKWQVIADMEFSELCKPPVPNDRKDFCNNQRVKIRGAHDRIRMLLNSVPEGLLELMAN